MNHPVGAEIEATAQWLEQRGANGAANVLRRVAHQRDRARDREDDALARAYRYRLAWRSARRRAEHHAAGASELSRQLAKLEYLFSGKARPSAQPVQEVYRENAMMRTDLARFQNLVERAGWMPDAEPRRLWRWRNGWWELAYRKRNPKDGYHDSGWYLWGPVAGCFGEWTAGLKADATTEADRLITKHLSAQAEAER
ncbi:hypothetical protein [Streptomyces sp. TRM68367]|uniref:hypothetical protein n=1 Tax=Streptomyces sp. TRM68367 TaxID=2758415 RepID=UPI00165C08D1|nr:hypothetical protein [Streptomyces sp. TRM68367]MBC9724928.1 hypothetical protein [Streptomyces sp. TRM68367]